MHRRGSVGKHLSNGCSDDFIDFGISQFQFTRLCDGRPTAGLLLYMADGQWSVGRIGGATSTIHELDVDHRADCTRGWVEIPGRYSFLILSDVQDGSLVIPMTFYSEDTYGPDHPGQQVGDVRFTKEEFLEWLGSQNFTGGA